MKRMTALRDVGIWLFDLVVTRHVLRIARLVRRRLRSQRHFGVPDELQGGRQAFLEPVLRGGFEG